MRWLILPLLIMTAFAGCASNDAPAEVETQPAEETSSLGAQVNATVLDGNFTTNDNADAFLLPAKSGAATPIQAFHWRVPRDALVPHDFFDDWEYLVLEIGLQTNTSVTSWGVMVFNTDRGVAQLVGSAFGSELTTTGRGLAPSATTVPASLDPFVMRIGPNSIQEGDRLSFVVFAEGPVEADFGVAFRTMKSDPDFGYEARNAFSILQGKVAELLPIGGGEGANVAVYMDLNALGISGLEAYTPAVTVEDRFPVDGRPAATTRDVTISSFYDGAGWSIGGGTYISGEAHGMWSGSVDSHGTTFDGGSLIMMDLFVPYVFLAELILFGLPVYVWESNGEGSSTSSFDVLTVSANVVEVMLFQQIDLGATMEDLVGVPAQGYGFAFTGLAGNIPPGMEQTYVQRVGNDLVVVQQGHTMTFPGWIQ